ncbi:hypothetical protein [Lentisalinibacter salinarum]|uniref:hypothetical protein n=1 Tax=Lentisalinibacter salinarum TaxID=2992239 RepID=UPI003870A05C
MPLTIASLHRVALGAVATELTGLLDAAAARLEAGERDAPLARQLAVPGRQLGDTPRKMALKDTLQGIADRLTTL